MNQPKYLWHLIGEWLDLEDLVALERTSKALYGHFRVAPSSLSV